MRAHALSIMGDTLVTLALANSVFFDVSPEAAREKVLLYLVLTMAPFALVSPLLGPWIDATRGGRRLMIILAAFGRSIVCLLLIDDLDGLLLYPEAFAALVLAKSHAVARSALVPTVVRSHDELVEANSKLTVTSGVVGFAIGIPGIAILRLGGATWILALAMVAFAAAAVAALKIPKVVVAAKPTDELERAELRGAGVLLAASAMALMRGIVGFLTFFVAFFLRADGAPAWWFGVVIALSALGGMGGAALAAPLRRSLREERILVGALLLVSVMGGLAAFNGGRLWVALLAASVGVAAASGKTAFDAIVQRDAPDANQGRSFARFETRFQMAWVIGAVPPVLISLPARAGFVVVAGAATFAVLSYLVGGHDRLFAKVRRRPLPPSTAP